MQNIIRIAIAEKCILVAYRCTHVVEFFIHKIKKEGELGLYNSV